MRFNPVPWLLVVVSFGLSLWARFGLIEQRELGFFCDGGGRTPICDVRWLIVQTFNHYGSGYLALFLGLLAAITRSGFVGCLAAVVGAAGLVLYTWDFAAIGFLLGILTLARSQLSDYRYKHGTRQH